nr:MAG TPA: hypothetical protein [Caudoviricetes sp.]
MKKRMSAKQRYRKERDRLVRALREVKKAGYIPAIELPTVKEMEKKGSDFRKESRRLAKIKRKKVGEIGVVDPDTGEIITLKAARKIIREAPQITMIDTVLAKFDAMPDYRDFWKNNRFVERVDYRSRYNILAQIIFDNVKEYGKSAVEKHLERNEEKINIALNEQIHDSDAEDVKRSFVILANLIKMKEFSFSQLAEISDLGEMFDYEET